MNPMTAVRFSGAVPLKRSSTARFSQSIPRFGSEASQAPDPAPAVQAADKGPGFFDKMKAFTKTGFKEFGFISASFWGLILGMSILHPLLLFIFPIPMIATWRLYKNCKNAISKAVDAWKNPPKS